MAVAVTNSPQKEEPIMPRGPSSNPPSPIRHPLPVRFWILDSPTLCILHDFDQRLKNYLQGISGIWRCIYMICRRDSTPTGFPTSVAATTCSRQRWLSTERFWAVTYGRSNQARLISSSSPSTCPATSAPLMAFRPLATQDHCCPPPLTSFRPSIRSGTGAEGQTTSSSRLMIMERVSTPW